MDEPYLRIGALSQRVGVSPELLRAWEQRYGLLAAPPLGRRVSALLVRGRAARPRDASPPERRGVRRASGAAGPRGDARRTRPCRRRVLRRSRVELRAALDRLDETGCSRRARPAARVAHDRDGPARCPASVPARARRALGARRDIGCAGALCEQRPSRATARPRARLGQRLWPDDGARLRAGRAPRPPADRCSGSCSPAGVAPSPISAPTRRSRRSGRRSATLHPDRVVISATAGRAAARREGRARRARPRGSARPRGRGRSGATGARRSGRRSSRDDPVTAAERIAESNT